MSTISEAKAAVKARLQRIDAVPVTVYDFIPDRWEPLPIACITPGDPYIEGAGTYANEAIIRFDIALIISTDGENADIEKTMDLFIEDAMLTLRTSDMGVQRVGQPSLFQVGQQGTQMLAVIITATTRI